MADNTAAIENNFGIKYCVYLLTQETILLAIQQTLGHTLLLMLVSNDARN